MANENKTAEEYVQKGYLMAHLANCGIRTINYDEWERLCECIHEAKPADVKPVVRGEWELIDAEEPIRYGCSVCKRLSWVMSNYCPNCGARMVEE